MSSSRKGQRIWRTYRSSGKQTASALIYTGSGIVGGIGIIDDGTNAARIDLYDNTSGSGTVVMGAVSGGDGLLAGWENSDVEFETGLYANVTQAAGTVEYWVLYQPD
jgi:hypothetical protein